MVQPKAALQDCCACYQVLVGCANEYIGILSGKYGCFDLNQMLCMTEWKTNIDDFCPLMLTKMDMKS